VSAWPLISFRCGARTATWKASTYPYVRCDLTRPTQHLGPHAPTFLALVVEERRSVVPHVEAHPPHRRVAFRARCRWPQPDPLPNRPGSARGHSLSSSREEIEEARRSPTRSGTSTTGAVRSVVSRTGAWSTAPPSVVPIDVQRPGRATNIGATREWGCGPSAVVAAGVKPADYIVRTTTAPAEVALVVDDAPDEESASATTFTLSHLGGAPADVR